MIKEFFTKTKRETNIRVFFYVNPESNEVIHLPDSHVWVDANFITHIGIEDIQITSPLQEFLTQNPFKK